MKEEDQQTHHQQPKPGVVTLVDSGKSVEIDVGTEIHGGNSGKIGKLVRELKKQEPTSGNLT